MGGNLFTHAMSAAEVQSHEVWLKRKWKVKTYILLRRFAPEEYEFDFEDTIL